ncbi:MAG: phosphatase PAP2 family protein [Caulobacteraceae bacterium]
MEYIQSIDNSVLDFIRTHMSSGFLDHTMPFITRLGSGGMIWIAVTLAFLISRKYRTDGLLLASSLLFCLLIGNIILKPLVARIRPCDVNTAVALLIPRPTDFSFPSGHSMSSFAATTVIFHANRKMGIAALILAILIAFSRLYLYVHYPSDIIAGLVIGILISVAAIRTYQVKIKGDKSLF